MAPMSSPSRYLSRMSATVRSRPWTLTRKFEHASPLDLYRRMSSCSRNNTQGLGSKSAWMTLFAVALGVPFAFQFVSDEAQSRPQRKDEREKTSSEIERAAETWTSTQNSRLSADLDATTLAEKDAQKKREAAITDESPMRLRMEKFIKEQQQIIVGELEKLDGHKFRKDEWERKNGGGGITCVLQDGDVFEKAGVNISVVYGTLPKPAIRKMHANHKMLDPNVESLDFFAAGLSMVLHPKNPMAPTVHLNYRYFETANPDGSSQAWWFGGGSDLTPAYLFDEDAIHFHNTLKDACDCHDKSYYPRFKKWCDEYFYNKHREECRGVGGIFFDDLDEAESDQEKTFAFIQDCLKAFIPSYLPILEKRKDMPFNEEEKEWQQIRRGKYVEFNLVHDRGTSFGLNTPGSRVESILVSLPLTASWKYMHEPEFGSREQRLVDILKNPQDWL